MSAELLRQHLEKAGEHLFDPNLGRPAGSVSWSKFQLQAVTI